MGSIASVSCREEGGTYGAVGALTPSPIAALLNTNPPTYLVLLTHKESMLTSLFLISVIKARFGFSLCFPAAAKTTCLGWEKTGHSPLIAMVFFYFFFCQESGGRGMKMGRGLEGGFSNISLL